MAFRRIAQYRIDECLRKKSKNVEKIDKRILILLDDMLETMRSVQGVGIAAVQVGVLKRVVVIDVGEGVIEIINPEIIEHQGEQQDIEGCLSVPNVMGKVVRPSYVKIKALDRNGISFELEGRDLLARAICHEIDHLDGILFIDKYTPDTSEEEQ